MSFQPAPLLDLLYDAALEPELWSAALNLLADEVGGYGNVLTQVDIWDGTGASLSNRRDPEVMKRYFSHYAARNPLHQVSSPEQYIRSWKPRILVDDELLEKASLVRSEFYNDWMRPNGMHSVMMMRLALSDGRLSVFNVSRPKHKGAFTSDERGRAAAYHPHLMRAFRVAQDLQSASSASIALDSALDQLSVAVFILDSRGNLRHANRAAEELLRSTRSLAIESAKLRATDPRADGRLSELISRAARRDDSVNRGGTVQLRLDHGLTTISLRVVPLNTPRLSAFVSGSSVLVYATPSAPTQRISHSKLMQAFKLSAAEARIASELVSGSSLLEIATASERSINTVKAQLSSIFAKMGIHRQADLVRAISALSRADR